MAETTEKGARQKRGKCKRCNLSRNLDDKNWCNECNQASNPDTFENCVKCKRKVLNEENGLQCDSCLGWYHAGCDQVDIDAYKVLKKSRYIWCCRGCSPMARENLQTLKEMKRVTKELQNENAESKALIMKHEERLQKLENKQELLTQIKEEIKEDLREEEDRKSRKNNLVLYRIPEKKTEEETTQNDLNTCKKVFTEVLEVREIEITEVKRLGKPTQGKSRPLLVKVSDPETKFTILREAKKLRNARDKEMADISISSDMTRKQREVLFTLRNELKEKRDQGDFSWYIDHKNATLRKKSHTSHTVSN